MKQPSILALFCGVVLSACGNSTDGVGSVDIAKSLFASTTASMKPAAPGSLGLTREALDQIPTPVLLATIESRGQQALLGELQSNNGTVTWSTLDDVTISLRNGVIVATRGLGNDLMASSGNAGLASGDPVTRTYTHLSGEDREVQREFICSVIEKRPEPVEIVGLSYRTTRITEVCRTDETTFENVFWFTDDQKIRKSRQWISEDVGSLTVEDLRR